MYASNEKYNNDNQVKRKNEITDVKNPLNIGLMQKQKKKRQTNNQISGKTV